MRTFNDREKDVLNRITSIDSPEPIPVSQLLESFFFTEQNGRALIIQLQSRYAVFFLQKEVFDNEIMKKEELEKFLELISLLNYLKHHGYILIHREEKSKEKKMFFIQDSFNDPQPSTGAIFLNAKGDYTSSPDTIHDKEKNIIYHGVVFDADIFDLITNVAIGTLYISQNLRHLVHVTLSEKKKISRSAFLFLNAVAIHLIIVLIVNLFEFKLKNYEEKLESPTASHNVLQNKLGDVLSGIQKLDSMASTQSVPLNDIKTNYYGVDISKWNGNIVKDINAIDSLTFVICKATEGISIVDTEFASNWKMVKERGLIRGAYHFYKTKEDPIRQAEFFLSKIDDLGSTDIAPIVDIEAQSLPLKINVDKTNVQIDLLLFLKHIKFKSERLPIIYSSRAFANEYLTHQTFSEYPLWLAEYTNQSSPSVPKVWQEQGYKIWQKSNSYSVNSKKVDFDIYYGKKSDLYD